MLQSCAQSKGERLGRTSPRGWGVRPHFEGRAILQPRPAAVAVLTLPLGVGANTAIFTVLRAVVLRDLPYRDADRIAVLWTKNILSIR